MKLSINEPYDVAQEVSIKEFAEANDLDYLEAQGFLKTLNKLGHCPRGKDRKKEGQKGKPTNIYMIPTCLQVTVYEAKEAA